ncbi:oxidoreductase, short chain dehydrogenase/reductase family protein [Elysia marginata]|uniref:Oxidoreductase, short chain dehydrogenase/reductase family protein n=1 Tax=Elysia marginata TaxID=1093978 RepID=A0AAV4FVW6_9GAST|nr:oxidoreductase, short chain dehydrogenase/reductase family protein [Elysia marginata]
MLIPHMEKGGHFVAISSMGGIQGAMKFPGLAAYSSSKAALNILFEVLAETFKDKGLVFNSLALGAVRTEMLKAAFPDFEASTSVEQMGAYVGRFALEGRLLFNGKTIQVSNTTP